MKAIVEIEQSMTGTYWAIITINHDMLLSNSLETIYHKSKGQLKRKVIQFCADLNLEVEWI